MDEEDDTESKKVKFKKEVKKLKIPNISKILPINEEDTIEFTLEIK